jgi:AbrB family looped-hinge helix DNA binding protein
MINYISKKDKMDTPKGKKFYGSVTVSERGQIVIPADARKDFNIKTGDKLLIFGDLEQGLGISTFEIMQKTMQGTASFFQEIGQTIQSGKKDNQSK